MAAACASGRLAGCKLLHHQHQHQHHYHYQHRRRSLRLPPWRHVEPVTSSETSSGSQRRCPPRRFRRLQKRRPQSRDGRHRSQGRLARRSRRRDCGKAGTSRTLVGAEAEERNRKETARQPPRQSEERATARRLARRRVQRQRGTAVLSEEGAVKALRRLRRRRRLHLRRPCLRTKSFRLRRQSRKDQEL